MASNVALGCTDVLRISVLNLCLLSPLDRNVNIVKCVVGLQKTDVCKKKLKSLNSF